jgi:integrase/recombinase XerD
VNPVEEYISYLIIEKGLSQSSISSYKDDIKHFVTYIESIDRSLLEIDQSDCEIYFEQLKDLGYKSRSLSRKISSLKSLFSYFSFREFITLSPLENFRSIVHDNSDRTTLTHSQIDDLYSSLDINHILGARDMVIIDLMYSCGMRISEVIGLTMDKISFDQSIILVDGKGSKQRYIPFGDETRSYLNNYCKHFRIHYLKDHSPNNLILNRRGSAISRMGIWKIVKKLSIKANLPDDFHPHSLRHTYATHLIDGGADIRSIQLLLGHEDISTTQIYTNISSTHLKEIIRVYHPRGK